MEDMDNIIYLHYTGALSRPIIVRIVNFVLLRRKAAELCLRDTRLESTLEMLALHLNVLCGPVNDHDVTVT